MEDKTTEAKSSFNEASFKMKRLHELQERMNLLRQNPFGRSKYGGLCFCSHRDCLFSLYQEISSKCSEDERKEVKEKLVELRTTTRELDSRTCKSDMAVNWGIENKTGKTYELSWGKLKHEVQDQLFDCEELIRDLLDKHGFSTMDQESDIGDTYN